MSLPTNTELFAAIAEVFNCRDHRRGRKPGIALTILTGDNGKTVVTDHNTGCTAIVGKRTYNKKVRKTRGRQHKEPKFTVVPNETKVSVGTDANGNIVVLDTPPTDAQVAEAVDLCAKSDAVDKRGDTALADAYNLLNLLKKQYDVIRGSVDIKDLMERKSIQKKIESVKMIIKQLDPKATV